MPRNLVGDCFDPLADTPLTLSVGAGSKNRERLEIHELGSWEEVMAWEAGESQV